MGKFFTLLRISLVLFLILLVGQTSYACKMYNGSLIITTERELAEAQKYCAVAGSIEYTVFGAPRAVSFENLVSVGQALNFTGNSLSSLNLPKLEKVGWWIHIASNSYHQQYLESVNLPLLREGTVQIAVAPNLNQFIYDPCTSAVIDPDSIVNLKNLGLLKRCNRRVRSGQSW